MIEGPPHPNAAIVYLNWFLSKNTQEAFAKAYGLNSRRSDVTVINPATFPKPDRLQQYIRYDEAWANVPVQAQEMAKRLINNHPYFRRSQKIINTTVIETMVTYRDSLIRNLNIDHACKKEGNYGTTNVESVFEKNKIREIVKKYAPSFPETPVNPREPANAEEWDLWRERHSGGFDLFIAEINGYALKHLAPDPEAEFFCIKQIANDGDHATFKYHMVREVTGQDNWDKMRAACERNWEVNGALMSRDWLSFLVANTHFETQNAVVFYVYHFTRTREVPQWSTYHRAHKRNEEDEHRIWMNNRLREMVENTSENDREQLRKKIIAIDNECIDDKNHWPSVFAERLTRVGGADMCGVVDMCREWRKFHLDFVLGRAVKEDELRWWS